MAPDPHLLGLRRIEAAKRRSLVTPEGVDLSLKLADIGQRIAAFLVDGLIMIGILIGLTLLAIAAIAAIGLERGEIVAGIWLPRVFMLRNGYFLLFGGGPPPA